MSKLTFQIPQFFQNSNVCILKFESRSFDPPERYPHGTTGHLNVRFRFASTGHASRLTHTSSVSGSCDREGVRPCKKLRSQLTTRTPCTVKRRSRNYYRRWKVRRRSSRKVRSHDFPLGGYINPTIRGARTFKTPLLPRIQRSVETFPAQVWNKRKNNFNYWLFTLSNFQKNCRSLPIVTLHFFPKNLLFNYLSLNS